MAQAVFLLSGAFPRWWIKADYKQKISRKWVKNSFSADFWSPTCEYIRTVECCIYIGKSHNCACVGIIAVDKQFKKKWVIDPDAAEVVRKVFRLCMEGKGNETIARQLQNEKVLVPQAYWQSKGLP